MDVLKEIIASDKIVVYERNNNGRNVLDIKVVWNTAFLVVSE